MFDELTSAIDERHRGFFAKSGDARQVWALDTEHGRVVYLPEDGVDDRVREACDAGRLRCSMADCPDPRFIARGGELRRHHFAHKVAHTKHATAAVFRAEAVAMLADWARHFPSAEVATRQEGTLGAVAIRSKRTGKVITLAITYDRAYPYWREDAQSGHDQLLVGHTNGLLLPRSEHPRQPGLWCCGEPQLVTTIITRHGAAIAVNPQQRLVATLMTAESARSARLIPLSLLEHPVVCIVSDLDACRLDETGLVTPPLHELRDYRRRHASRGRIPSQRQARPAPPRDPARDREQELRREYLRRAQGLSTEQQLALIKELFLADKP